MVIKPVYNYGPEPVLEKEDYKITKKSKLRSQDYNKLTYISWLQQQLIAECQVSDWCPPFFSRLKQYQTLNKLDIIAISLFCAIFGKAKYELMLSRTGLSTNTSTLYKYSLSPFYSGPFYILFLRWLTEKRISLNSTPPLYIWSTPFPSFILAPQIFPSYTWLLIIPRPDLCPWYHPMDSSHRRLSPRKILKGLFLVVMTLKALFLKVESGDVHCKTDFLLGHGTLDRILDDLCISCLSL